MPETSLCGGGGGGGGRVLNLSRRCSSHIWGLIDRMFYKVPRHSIKIRGKVRMK